MQREKKEIQNGNAPVQYSAEEEWIRTLRLMGEGKEVNLPSEVSKKAPAYLKDQIMERSSRPDVRTAAAVHQTSKNMQLFYYSLKTAAAVLAALLLLFALPVPGEEQAGPGVWQIPITQRMTRSMNNQSSKWTEFLNKFSFEMVHGNGGNEK